jgi:hypothetical protein
MCSLFLLSLAAGCGEDPGPDSDADADLTPTSSASSTDAASPSEEPSAPPVEVTTLTTKGLGQGPPPSVDILAAADPAEPAGTWSLVRPSGEQTPLDIDRPFGFASTGNGLVVLEDGGDGAVVSVVDGNGDETSSEDALGYRLAVTPDGSVVAWLTADRSVRVLEAGGQSFDFGAEDLGSEIGAIWGRGTCLESQGGGCSAYVNVDEPRSVYVTTTTHGIVEDRAGSMLAAVDVDVDGRVVGLVSVTDEGSCSAVYTEPAEQAWETCGHTLTSFSPDGSRVLGTDAYLDGFGQRSVAFLDGTDGTPLHEFTSTGKGPSVLQTAWEDEEHVLAVVYERGRWSVVRLGADGSAELALGPLAGSDLERPFVLGER